MSHEELTLLIAECLIEPSFPEDPMKEAANIATRIARRIKINKSNEAILELNNPELLKERRKNSILNQLNLTEDK